MELPAAAEAVARKVIDQEGAARRHVVVYLSGSHAYGFPSPDSDVDLKAVHLAPPERFLGLAEPRAAFDRLEVVDGVEVDYTSNELGQVLAGILAGNGNFLERVLCPTVLAADEPLLAGIRALAPAFLSRKVHHHYRGFARQQQKALEKGATAKRLLYVLRTLATGIRLLEGGELVTDLRVLAPALGIAGVDALIARKQHGERTELGAAEVASWNACVDELFARIDAAAAASPLPAAPPDPEAVDAWLVGVRRALLN